MASCLLPGGSLDGFAQFCLEAGVLEVLEQFPDHRRRRSIPMFFFCNVMVHRPLFQLKRLAPIERTLFRVSSASTLCRRCWGRICQTSVSGSGLSGWRLDNPALWPWHPGDHAGEAGHVGDGGDAGPEPAC
jgi:hypothetical protein